MQLGGLSTVNIGLTFLLQWYTLTQLGPGIGTDALFAGMTLPQLVLAVISGSLMHVLVPLLAGEDHDELRRDAWVFFALVCGLFGLLAIVLYETALWWIPLIVPGFDESGKQLAVNLTRIQLIGMVFTAINGVQWAVYHAKQQFYWAEIAPLVAGIVSLIVLAWTLPSYGIQAAAWVSVLRVALQTLLLAPGMGKPILPDLNRFAIGIAWQRIRPLLLGTAYYKTDPLVDRYLLSTAASGNLSLYYLAQQIYAAVSQVVNKAIVTPMVPQLSKLHKDGETAEFQRIYRRNILRVGLISITGMAILGLFGRVLLDTLIGHGRVSADNVQELWWIMIWLAGAFVGGALGQISSSSFYASGDTKTPTYIGIWSYTLYIPAKIVAYYSFGIVGLALATSSFYIINFALQDRHLKSGRL